MASGSGMTKEYSVGRRHCFSSADLLSLVTALGPRKWLPGPPYRSERVGAPRNSNTSATISVTRGVRSFRSSTELPGLRDKGEEALVEAPSEDELLEEWLVAEPGGPDCIGVLELEEPPPGHQLEPGGSGIVGAGPPLGGQPDSPGHPHLMSKTMT
ncbi:hypothetical protein Cgig2_005306 [Carnegiea gigantea]|uniref:Uncharacterized protein n=1 Tax=Carnegiea gigantea TaxID=171969 RepID=A0A9Q1QB68_9CARY|nr:hypothetical protein Cgig2_005306 [Carnegiea gigantea]